MEGMNTVNTTAKFATLAFVAALSGLTTFSAQAASKAIGPAGCGLGNVVFGKENQILAATTNGTGVQTAGITSGTSNCDADSKMAQMTMFIETNRVALSNDVARGQGETVAALSNIMGCENSQTLGQGLKANYKEIFSNKENSIAISHSIQQTVKSTPSLAQSCQPLS